MFPRLTAGQTMMMDLACKAQDHKFVKIYLTKFEKFIRCITFQIGKLLLTNYTLLAQITIRV